MFNHFNYLIPEERQTWRSAYEIEIAALKHEERRIQMQQVMGDQISGLPAVVKASLQMLAALLG